MNDLFTNEEDYYDKEFKSIQENNKEFVNHSLSSIQIQQSSLLNCKFDNVIFNNVTFEKVDLSNTSFDNCGLHNCKFIDCKMVGVIINNCTIKNTTFETIIGRYMGISYTRLTDVVIKDSDLFEARFMDLKLIRFSLENVHLGKAEFNMVSLANIDLSTCNIENFLIDPKCLKGTILNYSQIINLVPLLGIKIK